MFFISAAKLIRMLAPEERIPVEQDIEDNNDKYSSKKKMLREIKLIIYVLLIIHLDIQHTNESSNTIRQE